MMRDGSQFPVAGQPGLTELCLIMTITALVEPLSHLGGLTYQTLGFAFVRSNSRSAQRRETKVRLARSIHRQRNDLAVLCPRLRTSAIFEIS
jgi:hypothetical protein